jgi:D-sedoheptulose 7-phosphate isomerase
LDSHPYFDYLAGLLTISKSDLNSAAASIFESILNKKSIWIIGNGGSASTAEHFETDLSFIRKGNSFSKTKVSALTANSSLITAIANDIGYENIFSHQLFRRAEPEDLCILISASGNSENLVIAARAAQEIGLRTLGILGFDGGKLAQILDASIIVRTETGRYGPVEDIHLAICHALAEIVGQKLVSSGMSK